MDRYSIQTTQNVEISYQIASVGDRMVALLIDWLVMFFYAFVAMILLGSLDLLDKFPWVLFLAMLPVVFYSLLCETFLKGQSVGKMAMKIKVARVDGSELTFGNILIRWIFRLVDFQLTWGVCALLTVIIGGKGQRLGDLVAGTTVLKLDAKGTIAETVFFELPRDYVPKYPEIEKLSDEDVRIIKEVLVSVEKSGFNKEMDHYLDKTSELVCEKMGVVHNLSPYKFLQTVLYDYNYYLR
ncbi:MAG: RDD family protein [Breznakibacter sp.]